MSTRRLAAILFVDVVGYTALMQKDEQLAINNLNKFKQELERLVPSHQGEIIQFYGDGCLVIFSSSVDAVSCARELLEAYQSEPQVPVRIGLHAGDVMFKEGGVFGDAVNLASRVESMGVPGAILFSKKVRDELRNQPQLRMVSLGRFSFKNVEEPMEVFALADKNAAIPSRKELKGKFESSRGLSSSLKWGLIVGLAAIIIVLLGWILVGERFSDPAAQGESVSSNSIAVLPFTNINKDAEGEIFCEGMIEEILTYLAGIEDLKVISRTSAMHYKQSDKKVPEIAQELGVAHILTGSVRTFGNKARITVQLIHASDDEHLWGENFDRELDDIFAIQSEVAEKIVQQLQIKISEAESNRLKQVPSTNKAAYQLYLRGKLAADDRSQEGLAKSVSQLKASIALDSTFADAYANLAFSRFLQGRYNYLSSDSTDKIAEDQARQALDYDESNTLALCVLGGIHHIRENYQTAKEVFEEALKLSPNSPFPHHGLGQYYAKMEDFENERVHRKMAVERDPMILVYHYNYMAVLMRLNQQDLAKKHLEKALKLFPDKSAELNELMKIEKL